MKTTLSADIPVSHIAVFAEMAWMERRPELGQLCRSATSNGNRLTPAVVQSSLPGLSDHAANNVISWCHTLGLCDTHGGITNLGEDVAKTNEAPIPEQGAYEMWIARHSLIGSKVLAVKRLNADKGPGFDAIEPLSVQPDIGKLFKSAIDKDERFLVRGTQANHGQPGMLTDDKQTCRIRWTIDFDESSDQWQIDGKLEMKTPRGELVARPIIHEPERDGIDVWALASRWASGPLRKYGRWNAEKKSLSVEFQTLDGIEIGSFRKTFDLGNVNVTGKGSYADVLLEDVRIIPNSEEGAQSWAMARLLNSMSTKPGYRSRAELRNEFSVLTEGTPLEEFSPTLPSHQDMLDVANDDRERFWSLAAPADLSPFELTEHDLGVLRVGTPTQTDERPSESTIRVPYRGGWPMRKFADRILNGASPVRVLLCDKYVRGEENLESLALLVSALRSYQPSVTIDIWTSEEESDFNRIATITGTRPRSYRETFGKSFPHDRYLLVVTNTGEEICWQMSNSPLHARSDIKHAGHEAPLRWKDLFAANLPTDELMPALRQWVKGK